MTTPLQMVKAWALQIELTDEQILAMTKYIINMCDEYYNAGIEEAAKVATKQARKRHPNNYAQEHRQDASREIAKAILTLKEK